MNLRERVLMSAGRVGLYSVAALARAIDTKPPYIFQAFDGSRPAHALIDRIAAHCQVSGVWLRNGLAVDAPEWARDLDPNQVQDARRLSQSLSERTKELYDARATIEQLEEHIAKQEQALAKLALQLAEREPEPVLRAAERTSRYKIGQTRKPVR